ncbi:MAG TPA: AIR synthase family protein [Nitrospinota bacterium]|nr:AIR synthase family protein [Nitrospinota bacterium]
MSLKAGKLDISLLDNLLKNLTLRDRRIKIGPKIGVDAAAIEMQDSYLVVASDPIIFVSEDIGYYAVNINANDIAALGAVPKWFLATLLFPEKDSSKKFVQNIFSQIEEACEELNVSLIGGHTEIVSGINHPIISGHMIGEVDKELLVATSGTKPGDKIILTKGLCIEGVSIIAREKWKDLIDKGISEDFLEKAKNFIYNPGISVVKEALLVTKKDGITSMHDPTEGGFAMGCYEISKAADVGMVVFEENIPIMEEARILCQEYHLDPLGTFASGALLLTVEENKLDNVLSIFNKNGIIANLIGEIRDKKEGVVLRGRRGKRRMPYFHRDEITKIF